MNGQFCGIPLTVLTLHPQIIDYLVFEEKSCEDTITPAMRHCRMPYTNSFRGGRETSAWVRIHAFAQRWKKTFEKLETTLKNKCGFSNVIVKFCETFICPTCDQHEIKTGGISF
jgi:hypothetical protein